MNSVEFINKNNLEKDVILIKSLVQAHEEHSKIIDVINPIFGNAFEGTLSGTFYSLIDSLDEFYNGWIHWYLYDYSENNKEVIIDSVKYEINSIEDLVYVMHI